MGWASGSSIMSAIIAATHNFDCREDWYYEIAKVLEEEGDADSLCELLGEDAEFDAAMRDLHPEWFDEEDE